MILFRPFEKLAGALCLVLLLSLTLQSAQVCAEQIQSRVELDAILSGGEEFLEDFEQVSLHDGTVVSLPNPFNSATGQSSGWPGLLSGISYSSKNDLQMRASGTNVLEASSDLTIQFDQPQYAVGFTSFGTTTNFQQTVTFFNQESEIGVLSFDSTPGFVGWQDTIVGITSVQILTTGSGLGGFSRIDDVAWGRIVLPPSPATDFTIVQGSVVNGTVADVSEADNSYLQLVPGKILDPNDPPVLVEFQGTISTDEPLTLAFVVESHANTVGLVQAVEFFNFTTNSFEELDVSPATLTDSTVVVAAAGMVRRFVETDTGAVLARIGWKAQGPILFFPWTNRIDQAAWLFTTE